MKIRTFAIALMLSALSAGCGNSGPAASTTGTSPVMGGSSSNPISGALGPGDGNSVYLNILVPGNNGNSVGGVGVPVASTPASYPTNYNDQATMYGDISYAQQGLQATPCTPPTSISLHVTSSNLACNYYKHDGLTPDTVVSTETLTTTAGGTVTIQRDGWGVPFISAANRTDAMYGIGYAMAEDRLWLMDILRNFGRGQLSKFLGPAPEFYQYDAALAVTAGYSESELTQMIDQLPAKFGDLGTMMLKDVDADLDGINAYIATLSGANAAKLPPEYAELKNGGYPPATFTRNDIVAVATLIQSIFAAAGGSEVNNEAFLQQLDKSITGGNLNLPVAACQLWRDLRHANDPDATRTISASFYESPAVLNESCPQTLPAGTAIWDVGSYQVFDTYDADGTNENLPPTPVPAATRPGFAAARKLLAQLLLGGAKDSPLTSDKLKSLKLALKAEPKDRKTDARPVRLGKSRSPHSRNARKPVQVAVGPYDRLHQALGNFGVPPSMSNWMAVTAANTVDGHPIGVMGPQVGYFQPHIVWEYAVHTTGGTPTDLVGRGMAIVGIPYIIIGRGVDYAWSITSNDGDIIDTRVSQICNLDGSTPSLTIVNGFPSADGYLYDLGDGNGPQCRRFYKRTDTWTATATLASLASGGTSLAQTVNRYVLRTHYGPVFATATIKGVPVVISTQRSNFFGETDGTPMFALASTPTVHGASSFQKLINAYTGTFNWLYIDKQDIGYIVTGLFPNRDPGQSPELPAWGDGRFEWPADKDYLKQNPNYFGQYGGDVPFPSRTVTIQQEGGPLAGGYYDYQDFLSYAQHPQVVNPPEGFMVSWNNSPATGWWAADNRPNWGPIHRIDAEPVRFRNFIASGKKFDFANVAEISADSNFVDIRGQALLPLLLQLMKTGTLTADETTAANLMQNWVDGVASDGTTQNGGSNAWINGSKGLGGWRRSRTSGTAGKTTYDNQPAVVLMDAWYLHLMTTVTSQLDALDPYKDVPPLSGACVSNILLCRQDAPRAQGSAYEFGWYQPMIRMLQTVLNTPGHHEYQALKCAGTGVLADCRTAVLSALDGAISDLGGISNMAKWDGTQLSNEAGDSNATVETYDEIAPSDFSSLPAQPIPWHNRPTYQQVIEITSGR
jgi:acyl-homoserine lactone acylase PvdQ